MLNNRSGYIKIGISKNPRYRETTLQAEEPEVLLFAVAYQGRSLERALHRQFAHMRLRGEWFALSPEDVQMIIRKGFEPVNGREDFYWAYNDAMTYENWMKARLIAEYHSRSRDNGFDEEFCDNEEIHRLSESLEDFLA
jgi:hypothetical protein